ncbi:MAG: hypothetical protein EOO38_06995 [Cytophagaceae bacterium]|nr:MAG: hypothetical protein EOO38_06995 [Cytophagaceae bacterium]
MARTRKLKPWQQQQVDAQKAREDAFEAAVQANPELYRTLKGAVADTRDAWWEIEEQYRALSMARTEASNLKSTLKDCGLHAEAAIAEGLLAIIEKTIQPILGPLRDADDAYELAKIALEKQFFPTEESA